MTSKEKLRLLYHSAILHNDDPDFIMEQTSYLEDLIKELEILEIIKNKNVATDIIPICKNAYDYSMKTIGYESLTDKEFNKLKEWLEK